MIRTNLSTRPFYNTAAVRFWLIALGLLVVAATVFNVTQVLRYSNSNTELVTRAANDEAQAAELRKQAAALRSSVDPGQVNAVSVDARQANDLIDRRTFSWTELFNRFERTLPDDVRITAVHPEVDKDRRIVLTVNVLARSVDDINAFMENLDNTDVFAELRSSQEHTNDAGQIESALQMVYVPGGTADAGAASAPSTTSPRRGGAR